MLEGGRPDRKVTKKLYRMINVNREKVISKVAYYRIINITILLLSITSAAPDSSCLRLLLLHGPG